MAESLFKVKYAQNTQLFTQIKAEYFTQENNLWFIVSPQYEIHIQREKVDTVKS